jgi:hypothetical protein
MTPLAAGFVATLLLVGCDRSESPASDEPSTPKEIAQHNSDLAAQALAASNKGVDDEGERIWKQDAREFFDTTAFPLNRTFELPWDWAREFTKQAYEAGAPAVWMVEIQEFELGGNKLHMSDFMVVELPKDPGVRQALIDEYNEAAGLNEDPTQKITDIGQTYLYIVGD